MAPAQRGLREPTQPQLEDLSRLQSVLTSARPNELNVRAAQQLLTALDSSNAGELTSSHLRLVLRALQLDITSPTIAKLVENVERSHSGRIPYGSLFDSLFSQPHGQAHKDGRFANNDESSPNDSHGPSEQVPTGLVGGQLASLYSEQERAMKLIEGFDRQLRDLSNTINDSIATLKQTDRRKAVDPAASVRVRSDVLSALSHISDLRQLSSHCVEIQVKCLASTVKIQEETVRIERDRRESARRKTSQLYDLSRTNILLASQLKACKEFITSRGQTLQSVVSSNIHPRDSLPRTSRVLMGLQRIGLRLHAAEGVVGEVNYSKAFHRWCQFTSDKRRQEDEEKDIHAIQKVQDTTRDLERILSQMKVKEANDASGGAETWRLRLAVLRQIFNKMKTRQLSVGFRNLATYVRPDNYQSPLANNAIKPTKSDKAEKKTNAKEGRTKDGKTTLKDDHAKRELFPSESLARKEVTKSPPNSSSVHSPATSPTTSLLQNPAKSPLDKLKSLFSTTSRRSEGSPSPSMSNTDAMTAHLPDTSSPPVLLAKEKQGRVEAEKKVVKLEHQVKQMQREIEKFSNMEDAIETEVGKVADVAQSLRDSVMERQSLKLKLLNTTMKLLQERDGIAVPRAFLRWKSMQKVSLLEESNSEFIDIKAWGRGNGSGRLGNEEENDMEMVPLSVRELMFKDVDSVSCGTDHSACVTRDGLLYTWGRNEYGQCGMFQDGKELLEQVNFLPTRVPFFTAIDKRVTQVACGKYHTIVLTRSGNVYSFGTGNEGALGHGKHLRQERNPRKVTELSNARVICIATGAYHSLAVTADGRVFSWGYGKSGRLGHGKAKRDHFTPTRVKMPALPPSPGKPKGAKAKTGESLVTNPVARVACGRDHSVVITHEGGVYTWGKGKQGQLGHGNLKSVTSPKYVSSLAEFRMVDASAGNSHTATLSNTGDMYLWGSGSLGQLGTGTYDVSPIPVSLPRGQVLSRIGYIACGGDCSACVTVDGELFVWGYGGDGQLGQGNTQDCANPKRAKMSGDRMDTSTDVVSISFGQFHTCCVTHNKVFV